MIPANNDDLKVDFQFQELPTNTFFLHISKDTITGFTDRLQAMVQAIYLILNTERYEHLIYSYNYGIELVDLIGQPIPFCIPEIRRRITEALMQDSRITGLMIFPLTISGERFSQPSRYTPFMVILKQKGRWKSDV
jgi:phage baseplate assembly protein W